MDPNHFRNPKPINQILRSYVELRLAKILETNSKDKDSMGRPI